MPTDLLPPISPPLESPQAAQTPIVGEPLPQPTTASTLLPTVVQSTPTRTPASATATVAQPTATTVLPTETAIPPTATTVPPTETAIPPTATASGPRRYTVQAGDTLRSIAERFGVTVQAILRANRLTAAQGDALRPGQEIIIP